MITRSTSSRILIIAAATAALVGLIVASTSALADSGQYNLQADLQALRVDVARALRMKWVESDAEVTPARQANCEAHRWIVQKTYEAVLTSLAQPMFVQPSMGAGVLRQIRTDDIRMLIAECRDAVARHEQVVQRALQ